MIDRQVFENVLFGNAGDVVDGFKIIKEAVFTGYKDFEALDVVTIAERLGAYYEFCDTCVPVYDQTYYGNISWSYKSDDLEKVEIREVFQQEITITVYE